MSAPNLKEIEWAISELEREETSKTGYILLAALYTCRNEMLGASTHQPQMTVYSEAAVQAPRDVSDDFKSLTLDKAERWVSQMQNEDGSVGPHWNIEQIRQLRQKRKELQGFAEAEVYAVINMMYSDYCVVAKKLSINNMDFYVLMTKAWLSDEDVAAGNKKTIRYYEHIVE